MNSPTRMFSAVLFLVLVASGAARADKDALRADARRAMFRATAFFRSKVATHGGYLWTYSLDFKERAGEGKATPSQIWVQPPGTPAVGLVFLRAYRATGDTVYLDGAVEAARALAWGQLESGGWDYKIDFDDKESRRWFTRRDVEAGRSRSAGQRNTTTFDDDVSQSATRLLMRVDKVLGFEDAEIHRAAIYALSKFMEAQYPNGAWPQRYAAGPDPEKFPVKKARYPGKWSRTYPKTSYAGHYTFNDNAISDVITTFLEAYDTYMDEAYRSTARKGGDFILLAQMPEPQPVWAQQYNVDMEPAWARKFEPPAVVSAESVGVIGTLLDLYLATGQRVYIATLPSAFAWFERSALPDGRFARFYELKTNKPLYFTKEYELTYSSSDMPTHYGFIGNHDPAAHKKRYEKLIKTDRATYLAEAEAAERASDRSAAYEKRVRSVIDQLDERGRWGRAEAIHVRDFNRNMTVLANYLAATDYR